MTWKEAWERDKHAVGRAVHEAWAAEKIKQGFADHAWPTDWREGVKHHEGCDFLSSQHHRGMVDFDALSESDQELDIQTGITGYRMGFEAASAADRSA